jgi:TatD DNase family protein
MDAAPLPDLVDSHCHLTWASFAEDVEAVIARMREAGVAQAVVVATDPASTRRGEELAEAWEGLFPTAGLHPGDLPGDGDDPDASLERALEEIGELLATGRFVAVGETGLDDYRDRSDRRRQEWSFRRHLALALRHDLPVIVHVRDRADRWQAYDDVARILEETPGIRGVIHCFTGTPAHAERYLAAGLHVSFSGILTFPKGENVRAAAAVVPLDRALVETDAPFLAPVPHRGRRNEPAYVAYTARALAEVLGRGEREVRQVTTENARRLFRLPAARPAAQG